jgi:HPt (histidine-containing phosphotransfer) domain-containing protein
MPIHKVLLLETDEAARSAGRTVLEQLSDWKVSAPTDPMRTLRQLPDLQPDLLLLDADLLEQGSADTLAQTRGHRSLSRLVVIVTATVEMAPPPGSAGVIRKPFQAATLLEELQRLFAAERLLQQLSRLHEIGGPDFVAEMIDLFRELGPQRLEAARTGFASGDLAEVARAVHPLKSSAGNLGADRVQDLAERTEQMALAGCSAAMPVLLRQLELALVEVYGRLQALRGPTS